MSTRNTADGLGDAQAITLSLGGRWFGNYGQTYCPAHLNVRTPALSLSEAADGRLLATCHSGCDFTSIIRALRGLGLLESDRQPDFREHYTHARASEVKSDHATAAKGDAEKRSRQALRLWREALPVAGTPAETYLRGRGITCPLPKTLRFHPSCWHPTGKRLPALVAFVEGAGGAAVHRTYLRAHGDGKADVEPARAMLGTTAGGAVRLATSSGRLVVAEGMETALSLLCGLMDGPLTLWAALSTSGLRGLRLPAEPGRLTIAADGDPAGHEAAYALATRAGALGWKVATAEPPAGADWNDILMKRAMAA